MDTVVLAVIWAYRRTARYAAFAMAFYAHSTNTVAISIAMTVITGPKLHRVGLAQLTAQVQLRQCVVFNQTVRHRCSTVVTDITVITYK